MKREEQRRIVEEMLKGHAETMRTLVERVPEDWDGHELRQLFADRAREDFASRMMTPGRFLDRRRQRAYENARITSNL